MNAVATIIRSAVLLIAAMLFASAAGAQTVTRYTNTTDSAANAINDAATPCTARFTRQFSVGTSYTLSDVNIGVLMAHTYRSDLNMYLVSPAGTRVQILNRIGGGADNFNALLDDQASSNVSNYTADDIATATTAVPPYVQSYAPFSALSAFNGQNAQGTWTLEICDSAGQDSGTFYQADLYITRPPTSYADLSLSQTVSNASPTLGSTITYSLTVASSAASNQTATGIVVRDQLPAGVTFVSYSGTGTYSSATGDWTIASLAPGQSATLTITGTVTASAGATVANPAEIIASSAADLDSTPNNAATGEDDYASASFTVGGTRLAGTAPSLSCPAGSTIFDWDARAWTAGSTSNSYQLDAIGQIGFVLQNPGTWLSNATYGGQSPARQNVVSGTTGQFNLFELVDLPNRTSTASTTINLPAIMRGAQFTIFDVDYNSGQFADRVLVVGQYQGATVLPTLTNGIANYVIGNEAFGDAVSADNQANGNVVVTFSQSIDTIIVYYGNHALGPTNPGQQAIAIHDITLCRPTTNIQAAKTSSVVSDPISGTTAPKAIPGATVRYCITVLNTGDTPAANVAFNDALPAKTIFVPGSIKTGDTCATATMVEDDDATGPDETNPHGGAFGSGTVTASAVSLSPAGSFAITFDTIMQ
ncbi:MAG: proprotein convertase P-domain-containing protein [Novosphingobium sp.]